MLGTYLAQQRVEMRAGVINVRAKGEICQGFPRWVVAADIHRTYAQRRVLTN